MSLETTPTGWLEKKTLSSVDTEASIAGDRLAADGRLGTGDLLGAGDRLGTGDLLGAGDLQPEGDLLPVADLLAPGDRFDTLIECCFSFPAGETPGLLGSDIEPGTPRLS